MTSHLRETVAFLRSIGIACRLQDGATGFLEKIRIVNGGLAFQPDVEVEDVLHEAGHLAIIPERYRPLANDDLEGVNAAMGRDIDADLCEIDSPLMCAMLQASEPEATAWAFAAGMHLGLPPHVIISDGSYGGGGRVVRQQLQLRGHLGINGLWHSQMCARPSQKHLPQYPNLLCWTQHIGSDESDRLNPYRIEPVRMTT